MNPCPPMPLRPAASQELPGLPATFANPTPIRIWHVDDSDHLRSLLAGLMGNQPDLRCERGFSGPGPALAALAHETAPDVLLLDVHMRGANGLDAIRPIKSLAPATQVLMLTTFFDSQTQSTAMAAGASGFLLKSYPVERMIEFIREAHAHPLIPQVPVNRPLELAQPTAAATAREKQPRGWWSRGLDVLTAEIELPAPLVDRGRSLVRGWLGLGKSQSAAIAE